ncbi:transposase domain-containing protein [Plantactinospora sp. WMMB334]|uniref:transposase domain-containing protein n=1 Tax=Plantactinospora sp. WMMB334 TaxID=3404119 RepID=UPI003B931E41
MESCPPHVMVYFAMALALFADDDYEEVAVRLTETLGAWGVLGSRVDGADLGWDHLGPETVGAGADGRGVRPGRGAGRGGADPGWVSRAVAVNEYRRGRVGRAGHAGERGCVRVCGFGRQSVGVPESADGHGPGKICGVHEYANWLLWSSTRSKRPVSDYAGARDLQQRDESTGPPRCRDSYPTRSTSWPTGDSVSPVGVYAFRVWEGGRAGQRCHSLGALPAASARSQPTR